MIYELCYFCGYAACFLFPVELKIATDHLRYDTVLKQTGRENRKYRDGEKIDLMQISIKTIRIIDIKNEYNNMSSYRKL